MVDVKGLRTSVRKAGANFAGDRHRFGGGGGRGRAAHPVRDRLLAGAPCPPRLSGAMRWCSFPTRAGRWQPAAAAPGLQTAPGLIVYRFGVDLVLRQRRPFRRSASRAGRQGAALRSSGSSSTRKRSETWTCLRRRPFARLLERAFPQRRSDRLRARQPLPLRRISVRPLILPPSSEKGAFSRTLHEALDAIRAEGAPI